MSGKCLIIGVLIFNVCANYLGAKSEDPSYGNALPSPNCDGVNQETDSVKQADEQIERGKKKKEKATSSLPLEENESLEEEVYIMSDFEVTAEGDQGYYSANTTGATRANTLVKNTPMTLTVVNQELLEDLDIITDEDLEMISPSIESDNQTWSLGQINIRGFSGGSRYDMFARSLPRDGYNVGRLDIIRGANSLIYGQADPGGRVNYVPKVAMFNKNSKMYNATFGNKNYKRFMIDYNEILNDQLAFRVLAVKHSQGYRQIFKGRDYGGITMGVSYKPTKNTQFRAHLELVDSTLGYPNNTMTDGTQIDATGLMRALPYSAEAIDMLPENVRNAIDSDPRNIANGISTQSMAALYSRIGVDTYGSHEGTDAITQNNGYLGILEWTQRLNDNLQFKLSYRHEEFQNNAINRPGASAVKLQDPTQQEDGTGSTVGQDEPYIVTYFNKRIGEQIKDGLRFSMIHEFDLGKTKHTWISGYDFDYNQIHTLDYDMVFPDRLNADGSYKNLNTSSGWTTYGVDVIRLSDGLWGPNMRLDFYGNNPYGIAGYKRNKDGTFKKQGIYLDQEETVFTLESDERNELTTHAFWTALQSEFFNGRLRTLSGIRYDKFNLDVSELLVSLDGINGDRNPVSANDDKVSSTLGALYWLTEGVAAFANFSQSIRSPSATNRTIFGKLPEAEIGTGIEYGLRFDLLKGKLNGQIVCFHIEKENDIKDKYGSWFVKTQYPNTEYPELYVKDPNTGDVTNTLHTWVGDRLNGVVTRASGIESEFYYNPSKSLTFTCAYNYTNYDRLKFPESAAFLAGEQIFGQAHHKFTLIGKYSFSKKGPLGGLSIGCNQRYRSGSIAKVFEYYDDGNDDSSGTNDGSEIGELRFDEEWSTGVFANYVTTLGSGKKAPQLSMRFSINNLLDNKGLINRGTRAMFQESRNYNIGAKLTF